MKRHRVAFKTLGCKLNQAETESIATEFMSLGWEITDFGEPADVVVVNSCTVTNTADRKSRATMNQALRTLNDAIGGSAGNEPGLLVMAGCYVDAHREALEADGRTYIVGNNHKSHIPQLVDAHFKGELLPGYLEGERDPFGYPLAEKVFRTRAMIKVQDGCDDFCTYCIIPFVRGKGISRPLDDTVRAVEQAAASGFREIVLTGVNITRWAENRDGGTLKFANLVEACLNADGDFRLRLGSVEPDIIDEHLISLMAHPQMTPHMHLCLQSGSDKILSSMRRQYTVADFEKIAEKLRQKTPGFNLTTDIIAGFPGESEKDFADTLDVCERLGFGHIHTFPYSSRERTRAGRMNSQVSDVIKKTRAEEVRKLSTRTKRIYRESLVGSPLEVLVEKSERGAGGQIFARGFSASYVPVRFFLSAGEFHVENVQNRIFSVFIEGLEQGDNPDLVGAILPR